MTTIDIPNAIVETKLNLRNKDGDQQKVIIKIMGKISEIIIKMAPKLYQQFSVYEKIQVTIYVKILKTLYGLILA